MTMITNATEFITDLHQVLRGALKRADDDVAKTLKAVVYKLHHTQSLHYELSRWRCADTRNHEFTFRLNDDGSYTYLNQS